MEGKIPMTARRHVTNKLRTAYTRAAKSDKSKILDEVIATTGMGRSSARRMLTGGVLPDPCEQLDQLRLRPKGFSDDSRLLLEHVWALMGFPCGKYVAVMSAIWLPRMVEAGDLDKPFATTDALAWYFHNNPFAFVAQLDWVEQSRRRPSNHTGGDRGGHGRPLRPHVGG